MTDAPLKNSRKLVGIWICTALVVGNMVGSGIFLLPSALAPYGGVSLLGWLATTFGALMTALVFVSLSRRLPRQGGPYRYAFEQLGPLAGFAVAWSYWVSIWCGNAAITVAAVSYLSFFVPQIQTQPPLAIGVSLMIIWTVTLINLRGVRAAGIFQLLATILKLAPLVAIGMAAFFVFEPTVLKPLNPSGEPLKNSIAATAALTLWAFLGLESATIPADNVKQPGKTIPRATLIGFAVAAVVYISSQLSVMSLVPAETLANSSAPFADAAQVLWGSWAGLVVAAGAVISCVGALNGWVLLQGQVPMTAARDGLFPAFLCKAQHNGASANSLVLSSVIITFLVVANFSHGLVSLFTLAILISTLAIFMPYLLSIIVEIRLIVGGWSQKPRFLALTISLLALLYCLWAISGIGAKAMLWGSLLILSGFPLYWFMRRRGG